MSIEIKTATVEPIRQTFSHTRRRFGDKPASRYQEASFDIEAATNFHYRPLWQPDKLLNDPSRTAVQMADWYAVSDPRQYYYGAYVQARARMQENAEHSFAFCEKRELLASLPTETRALVARLLLPLRHAEPGRQHEQQRHCRRCVRHQRHPDAHVPRHGPPGHCPVPVAHRPAAGGRRPGVVGRGQAALAGRAGLARAAPLRRGQPGGA